MEDTEWKEMELGLEHIKALKNNLYKFQQSGQFTDVSLIINGDEFKAHRHILACHSQYFYAMFNTNMLESSSPLIKISGVNTTGFNLLLRYMYTGKLTITEDNVPDILATAIYLQVEPVSRKCTEFLEESINMDNMLDIMDIANLYNLDSLRSRVLKLFSTQFLSRSDIVQNLDAELIHYAVSQDLPVTGREIDMLRVVLKWFVHGSRDEVEQKAKSSKQILQHIHFEEISYKSFKTLFLEFFATPCLKNATLKETLYTLYKAAHKQKRIDCQLSSKVDQRSTRGMKPAILRVGGFTRYGLTNEISYSFTDEREWHPLTIIPNVAQCNYGTAVLNNQLYIVGGCFNQRMLEIVHPSSFRYDPWSNTWTATATITVDRCRFTLTAMNNKLYAVGGATLEDSVTNTAECYDIETNKWSFIESLPECRQQHAAVALEYENTNLLFVSGGLLNDTVIASMFMYNDATGTWTSCAPLLAPRTDHVMFAYKGEIYVCGGWYTEPGVSIWSRWMRTQVPTIDVYNIQTNTWRHVTTLPRTRYHEDVTLYGSKLYLIGGFHRWNVFNKHTEVECYDLESDTWTSDVKNAQDYWEHANVLMNIPKY